MITIRPAEERGHADHGWLDARHTFSFAGYHDPEHMGFGPLRVLNQDRVAPGQGFGRHPHRDMEIVTVVLEGTLEHRDSMGNGSRLHPGEVQFMSAGSGVTHSEFNPSPDEWLHLLQMWVLPSEKGGTPRYAQKAFPRAETAGTLRRVVSAGEEDGALPIGRDVALHLGHLAPGDTVRQELGPGRGAWLHVALGGVRLNGRELRAGDGAGIREESALEIEGVADATLVLWDLPLDG